MKSKNYVKILIYIVIVVLTAALLLYVCAAKAPQDNNIAAANEQNQNSADTLVIDYYPSIGYACKANTYYKFTPELKNLLDRKIRTTWNPKS